MISTFLRGKVRIDAQIEAIKRMAFSAGCTGIIRLDDVGEIVVNLEVSYHIKNESQFSSSVVFQCCRAQLE